MITSVLGMSQVAALARGAAAGVVWHHHRERGHTVRRGRAAVPTSAVAPSGAAVRSQPKAGRVTDR